MRATYTSARKVLVLDRALLNVSNEIPALELYLRFKLSNWMRRLWTLQEGVLSKVITLQLKNATIDVNEIDERLLRTEFRTCRFLYTRYSFDAHTVLGSFLRQKTNQVTGSPNPQHLQLESYWKTLQWRPTSKRADETVCLGTILDVDQKKLAELLQYRDEDYAGRMTFLLRSLDSINLTMLYQPPPRLHVTGFRWAPTSFLACFRNAATSPYRTTRGTAQIGPDGRGLSFKSAGLYLVEGNDSLPMMGKIFIFSRCEKAQHC
jgi:hypothetical protein